MAQTILDKILKDLNAGRFVAAQKRVRAAAKKEPMNAPLQNLAGLCFARAGQHRAATGFFAVAAKLLPQELDYRVNYVQSLVMSGEVRRAESEIARAELLFPNVLKLLYLRGLAKLQGGDFHAAIRAANAALERAPNYEDALNVRGQAYSGLSEAEKSLADFNKIVTLNPDYLDARINACDRLLELSRFVDARAGFEAVLARDPVNAYALSKLALLKDASTLGEIVAVAESEIAKVPKDSVRRVLLHMAMANAFDRQGEKAKAMAHLNDAHALDARRRPYTTAEAWAEQRKIKALFEDDAPSPPLIALEETPCPLFVVGLPRSGTTLVEMILSAHPSVASMGELVAAERHFRLIFDGITTVEQSHVDAFAQGYRDDLGALPANASHFVDKMPANYRYIPLILAAFPNARVIDVRRDPRDVALSMWRQRFPMAGMNFASKMANIADQANLYRTYMADWQRAYPIKILSIDYEALVEDHCHFAHSIALHCGLEWHEAMSRPEDNRALVRTASVHQVRQRVHNRSVGNWTVLGDNLKVLEARLDPALWPELALGANV